MGTRASIVHISLLERWWSLKASLPSLSYQAFSEHLATLMRRSNRADAAGSLTDAPPSIPQKARPRQATVAASKGVRFVVSAKVLKICVLRVSLQQLVCYHMPGNGCASALARAHHCEHSCSVAGWQIVLDPNAFGT